VVKGSGCNRTNFFKLTKARRLSIANPAAITTARPGQQDLLQLRRPGAAAHPIPGGDHRQLGAHPGAGPLHHHGVAVHRAGSWGRAPAPGGGLWGGAPSAEPHGERHQRLRAAPVGVALASG